MCFENFRSKNFHISYRPFAAYNIGIFEIDTTVQDHQRKLPFQGSPLSDSQSAFLRGASGVRGALAI